MIDSYVLLTPILMLGVLALIRFVGCNWWYNIRETDLKGEQVEGLVAKAGDSYVELTWGYTGTATKFILNYGQNEGGPYFNRDVFPSGDYEYAEIVSPLDNGVTHYFKVQVVTASATSSLDTAVEVSAQPTVNDFLTLTAPGAGRNDFDGWVGMAILVKSEKTIVTQLGRWAASVNAAPHEVRIYDAAEQETIVTVVVPPGTPGGFSFVPLPSHTTLSPNGLYYIVSHESSGGDPFLNYPTGIQPIGEAMDTNVARVLAAVYSGAQTPDDFLLYGYPNETYGPSNFRY